jgi:outer membrane protein assembly factor BamB
MKRILAFVTLAGALSFLAGMSDSGTDYERYWPQWRGPLANGVAPYGDPPVAWSEQKNLRWKIEIPGKGLASPIVWDDKVFILTAIETDKLIQPQGEAETNRRGGRRSDIQPSKVLKFTAMAINRQDGKILWQRTAREEAPHEGTQETNSWASHSGVTDGKYFFAYFGSHGLYCYDMQGNLRWQTDLGDMATRNSFGEGSSPALYGNTLVVNWDHEGQSFIVALDKKNGKELWRANRDEPTSWTTPLIVPHHGRTQVIVSATNRVRSYDLANGNLIWECGGMTVNSIPSPVHHDGVVSVTSGFRGSSLQAIRLADAKGDITGSKAVIWTYDKDTPYVPSPLLYKDALYFLKLNTEILSCFNAKTGEAYYSQQRLEGIQGVYASPVAANDRVYFAGRNGATVVIKHGPMLEVLATNILADRFDASPAIVGNQLFLRGHKNLYCIASD